MIRKNSAQMTIVTTTNQPIRSIATHTNPKPHLHPHTPQCPTATFMVASTAWNTAGMTIAQSTALWKTKLCRLSSSAKDSTETVLSFFMLKCP